MTVKIAEQSSDRYYCMYCTACHGE